MVATYWLLCATGASVTATVCTGMACIAAGAAFFCWQPEAAKPISTKQLTPRMRFNAVCLTRSFLCPGRFGPEFLFVPD
jgi:hypothetical protein